MSNYICRLNENVKREHVRYYNRYGIALAGDLYTAKTMDQKQKHMAVIVGAAIWRRQGTGSLRSMQTNWHKEDLLC